MEKLLVEQTCLQCVQVRRTLVLEVPTGLRDPAWLGRFVKEGDADFGPFPFDPVEGSEYWEPVRLQILGITTDEADIPCSELEPFYVAQEEASNVPF